MVWPGMNQVPGSAWRRSSASSRSVATMPKSPREIQVGVELSGVSAPEVLSRSNVRQTKCLAMNSAVPLLAQHGGRCEGLSKAAAEGLDSHQLVCILHLVARGKCP